MDFKSFAQDAEAKVHGGEQEDQQRRQAIAQAKQEFDALMAKWQNKAYDIGGSFRGPGIWFEMKKGFKVPS